MAFKMTKADTANRKLIVDNLNKYKLKLEQAQDKYNQEVALLIDEVNSAIDDYNEVLTEAQGWRDDLVSESRDAFENKSEKWQESDGGQSADSWINDLESIDLDEIDKVEFDELDIIGDIGHADEIEEYPEDAFGA